MATKPTYKIIEVTIAPGNTLGNFVLYGRVAHYQNEGEELTFHDRQSRTSKIIAYDAATGTFETMNSFYQVV